MTQQTVEEIASDALEKLTQRKSLKLSDVMLDLRDGFLSEQDEERERGVKILVKILTQLPKDFIQVPEVNLLLDFFMSKLETMGMAGEDIVAGLRYLVVDCVNTSSECARPLMQNLFTDGNVQGWPQQVRNMFYDIFEVLVTRFEAEMVPLGSDVVMNWIRAMGGERDPRCLIKAFRIFPIVANKFPMGVLVEEMFEVVACYYPVDFKPIPGQDAISSDLLSSLCEQCLLAHPSFAPFAFMMVEEKFTDEETTQQQKYDVCGFLGKACQVFSAAHLLPSVETLLAGIRTVALHPKEKDAVNDRVCGAMRSIVKSIRIAAPDKLQIIAQHMLENIEPFVLQAEMGLADRALLLLEQLAEERIEAVMDRCLSWIVMLVQGDTVNTAANKADIAKEGLANLAHWVQIAKKMEYDILLDRYSTNIFSSIDVARERVPSAAMHCMYKCARVYLSVSVPCAERAERFRTLFVSGIKSVETDSERAELLSFMTTFAMNNFEDCWQLVNTHFNPELPKMFAILCAICVDETSWNTCTDRLRSLLDTEKLNEQLPQFTSIGTRAKAPVALLSTHFLIDYVNGLPDGNLSTESSGSDALAAAFQQIGLLLSQSQHHQICSSMLDIVRSSRTKLLAVFKLFLTQSNDAEVLNAALQVAKNTEQRSVFVFSLVNRGLVKYEDLHVASDLSLNAIAVKATLLAGEPTAVSRLTKLFDAVLNDEVTPEVSAPILRDLLDYTTLATDPDLGRHKCTPLWRQRVFCQFVPVYLSALSRCPEDRADIRSALLEVLAPLLQFSETIETGVEYQLEQLLPLFISTLSNPRGVDVSPIVSALSTLLGVSRVEEMSQNDVNILVDSLREMVQEGNVTVKSILSALDCLEKLAKRAKPMYVQPHMSKVLVAVTRQKAHRKRVVREKAAVVDNMWRLLVTK